MPSNCRTEPSRSISPPSTAWPLRDGSLEAGDTAQAARLLTWNEAWGGVSGSVGGGVFASLAYLERARIEDARGNAPLAQEYYREFLLRYDMPTARQRHLVDEAREAVARLSSQ